LLQLQRSHRLIPAARRTLREVARRRGALRYRNKANTFPHPQEWVWGTTEGAARGESRRYVVPKTQKYLCTELSSIGGIPSLTSLLFFFFTWYPCLLINLLHKYSVALCCCYVLAQKPMTSTVRCPDARRPDIPTPPLTCSSTTIKINT